jgi:HK97 family phage major capsid protein
MKRDINALLQMRATLQARIAELAELQKDGEVGLTDEQKTEFDAKVVEFDAVQKDIERLRKAEEAAAAVAEPIATALDLDLGPAQNRTFAVQPPRREPGHAFAMFLMAQAARHRFGTPMQDWLISHNAPDIAATLNTGENSEGGYIVPPDWRAELIPLLSARAVIRPLCRSIPMPYGRLTMSRQTASASAEYGAELDVIPTSEPAFGTFSMTWKKLTCLVPISNDLLRYSNPQVYSIVRDDMLKVMALREDRAFLRDDGSGDLPKGLKNWCIADNKIEATDTHTLSTADAAIAIRLDLAKAKLKLTKGFFPLDPGTTYWLLNPTAHSFLESLTSPLGGLLFPEMSNEMLAGLPYRVSMQTPENLGTGTNESEIYLADFSEIYLGDSMQLQTAVSTEAVLNIAGTPVNLFQQDATAVRAISEHDFAPRQEGAIAMLTKVAYGSPANAPPPPPPGP